MPSFSVPTCAPLKHALSPAHACPIQLPPRHGGRTEQVAAKCTNRACLSDWSNEIHAAMHAGVDSAAGGMQGRALLASVREVGRLRRELRAHKLTRAVPLLATPDDLLSGLLSPTAASSAAIPAHQGDRYSLSGTLPMSHFGVPAAERRAEAVAGAADVDESTALLYGRCSLDGGWVTMRASAAEPAASAALDPELEEQLTGAASALCLLWFCVVMRGHANGGTGVLGAQMLTMQLCGW